MILHVQTMNEETMRSVLHKLTQCCHVGQVFTKSIKKLHHEIQNCEISNLQLLGKKNYYTLVMLT